MIKGATLSEDLKYRFELHRIFDSTKPIIAFVGLNPSTADADLDDPTITKCINYCKSWNYGGFYMVNLFAYRATEPSEMLKYSEPIGHENDEYLKTVFSKVEKVICCWGELGTHKNRSKEVMNLISKPYCLKINKNGEPAHPLYLKGDLEPIEFTSTSTNGKFDKLKELIAEKKSHEMKSFKELDENILDYNNDSEIQNYLTNTPHLSDIYNEIKLVEEVAVVVALVEIDSIQNFKVNLNIIVKHENDSELGQWNFYKIYNFVANKINLVMLFRQLEGATNCDVKEVIKNIQNQLKELREEYNVNGKTYVEIDNETIAFGLKENE